LINRRFMIVPPALPSGGQAEQLGQTSKDPWNQPETRPPRRDEERQVGEFGGWDDPNASFVVAKRAF
jgi:hypothetical protein